MRAITLIWVSDIPFTCAIRFFQRVGKIKGIRPSKINKSDNPVNRSDQAKKTLQKFIVIDLNNL